MKPPIFVRTLSKTERKALQEGLHSKDALKALSCYGLYLPELKETWLRFVDDRPVSSITTLFLSWCCQRLKQRGKEALLLIWHNAIEPQWIHGKRKVVETERLLGAYELAERVCRIFDCAHEEHLSIPQEVA